MDGTVYRRHWLETWIQRTAMVQRFGQASDRASQHAGPGCIGRHTVEAVRTTVLRVSGDMPSCQHQMALWSFQVSCLDKIRFNETIEGTKALCDDYSMGQHTII